MTGPARQRRQAGHLCRLVKNRLGTNVVRVSTAHADGDHFEVEPERLLELVGFLQRDPDADLSLLVDVTAVDTGARDDDDKTGRARFEVHIQLRSPRLGYRARVVTRVSEADPTVPSLTPLYPAAELLEREMHELFGVYPEGHPQLRSVLLYPGFVGHPLRKDYRATKQQPLVALLDLDGDDAPRPTIIEAATLPGAAAKPETP